jgi:serine/threonine protein kinase
MVEARGNYESKYTEGEKLGQGDFGNVYQATHKEENKKYAAKKIRFDPAASDLQQLLKEVDLLLTMEHSNIVPYKEYFVQEAEGLLILIMDYCECKFSVFIIF